MRQKAKSPLEKYKHWIGMGVVLLVFLIVLLTVGNPSKAKSKPGSKKTTAERTERTTREVRVRRKKATDDRLTKRARRKLARERRREELRTSRRSGERTTKLSRSAREAKTRVEAGYVLEGIFVDDRGERYALIGGRKARTGDVVAGRKIQEIQTDRVSVEYSGTRYEVKIGSPLF